MSPIEVFYHFFIPNDHQAPNWVWWVDQQLQDIRDSKLIDIANINMAITMPKYFGALGNWPIKTNGPAPNITSDQYTNFEYKVREYIFTRYPFVNILDIRDTSEQNIYEGQTIKLLYDRVMILDYDIDVLYLHNKGAMSQVLGPAVYNWREILNHFCIKEWPKCVRLLMNNDIVAVGDSLDPNIPCSRSGNFWWSKSSYIKTLPDPLNTTEFAPPHMFPDQHGYRWSFEHWIGVNNPKIGSIAETNTLHYENYCFVENFSK